MKLFHARAIASVALFLSLLQGCSTGKQGGAFEQPVGPAIANVALTFVKEDGSASFDTTTNASGRYRISLTPGRYYALASHPAYEDYNSAPGFFVVNPNTMGVGNFFLRPPQMTTVLIVRHGEKQNPNSNAPTEPLSAAGQALGLDAETAERLAIETAFGAASMARSRELPPARLRENVTSKGGTTAAALQVFDKEGTPAIIQKAMQAAHDRAVEFGDQLAPH